MVIEKKSNDSIEYNDKNTAYTLNTHTHFNGSFLFA
jgi:hypothetical protein